jgi:hypothetical protein
MAAKWQSGSAGMSFIDPGSSSVLPELLDGGSIVNYNLTGELCLLKKASFNVQLSTINVQLSAINVQRSTFNDQRSTFQRSFQRSTFNRLIV